MADRTSFVLSAGPSPEQCVDIWQVSRKPDQFIVIDWDHPHDAYHIFPRRGSPYLKSEIDLERWLHTDLYEAAKRQGGRGKHFRQGWPTGWQNVPDGIHPTRGLRSITLADLGAFPPTKPRPDEIGLAIDLGHPLRFAPGDGELFRLSVILASGDVLDASSYLCRPHERIDDELEDLAKRVACLWVWTAWEPWSAIVVLVDRADGGKVVPLK